MFNQNKKILLDVPYYSQYLDVSDENWKSRACGILCLKMVIDFYKQSNLSADEFLKEGISRGGFGPSGWIHDILVDMAKDFDMTSRRKEYKSQDDNEESAIKEILNFLENNQPVIVSAVKNFSEPDKFHLVVLTGLEKDGDEIKGFYYHDPDSYDKEDGKHKFVLIKTFKNYWRKMAIYVKI